MNTSINRALRHMLFVTLLLAAQSLFSTASANITLSARYQQKGVIITITGDNVIGRDGPNGVDLGLRFNKGTRLTCVGGSGSWYQCKVNNRYVWVSSRYAKKSGNATVSQNTKTVVITGDRVVGRTTPGGVDSGKRFYKGQRLSCTGKSGSWFRVVSGGRTYWVSAQYAYIQ